HRHGRRRSSRPGDNEVPGRRRTRRHASGGRAVAAHLLSTLPDARGPRLQPNYPIRAWIDRSERNRGPRPEGAGPRTKRAPIMPQPPAPDRVEPQPTGIKEVHILWTPDGMSCDGDTVSVTAATQPSIEDIVMGNIPGLPKVRLHNRVLDYSL